MDNVTHTLVGLMLARAGLEKVTARGAGMMMLAANAPDIDAVSWFGGTTTYLEYHRGLAHSFIFMPVMALLPILLVRAKFTWRVWLASILGVLSHLLLDWTNSFGIPLLMPFSMRRWHLDTVNLVDIWLGLILFSALAVTALMKRRNRDVDTNIRARRGPAIASLLLFLAFEGFRWTTHRQAITAMEAPSYNGAPARRVAALPNAANPFFWRGVVETQGFVFIGPVNLRTGYDPSLSQRYPVVPRTPEMDAALATRPFQVFSRFSQLPYWQQAPVAGGVEVSLIDLRFGDPGNPGFAAVRAVVDRAGRVVAGQ